MLLGITHTQKHLLRDANHWASASPLICLNNFLIHSPPTLFCVTNFDGQSMQAAEQWFEVESVLYPASQIRSS